MEAAFEKVSGSAGAANQENLSQSNNIGVVDNLSVGPVKNKVTFAAHRSFKEGVKSEEKHEIRRQTFVNDAKKQRAEAILRKRRSDMILSRPQPSNPFQYIQG